MPISGGREEGFRATTRKNNSQEGFWRVTIETRGSREIGRINFKVITDTSVEPREMKSTPLSERSPVDPRA